MSQPEPKSGDVLVQRRTDLAEDRTDLAVSRTMLAASRTLLTWVRTALSMIGFGFTIYKVLQELQKRGIQLTIHMQGPRNLGLFLIGLGTLSALMGSLEYSRCTRNVRERYGAAPRRFPLVMASLVFVLGLYLFVSIILKAELF